MLGDEVRRGEVEDEAAIHLLVEVEVEVVECDLRITELRRFSPTLQQAVAATRKFIADQTGNKINRRHRFGLSLMQTSLNYGSDATKSQLA